MSATADKPRRDRPHRFKPTAERREERTCRRCGATFTVKVLTLPPSPNGDPREVGDTTLCAACLDRDDEQRQAKREAMAYAERQVRSGLPPALREIDFEGFAFPRAVEAAREWAARGGGLLLFGPFGVGKTRLAAAALNDALQRRFVRWCAVAPLMTQLRAFGDEEGRTQAARAIAGSGAIVLDDLDKANPSEYGREVIHAAVDGRVAAGAPLLVTTNLSPNDLAERLGESVASRLAGYCRAFEMSGPDRRLTPTERTR